MFSGKTRKLLESADQYYHGGEKVVLINNKLDNRAIESKISTHCAIGNESILNNIEVQKVETLNDVVDDGYTCFCIDEAQFFPDIVDFVQKKLREQKIVIVAGLMIDYKKQFFGKFYKLIPEADHVFHLSAMCKRCQESGRRNVRALFTSRTTSVKKQIQIGGNDSYNSLCRMCYDQVNKN
jgi:thymidine kinase